MTNTTLVIGFGLGLLTGDRGRSWVSIVAAILLFTFCLYAFGCMLLETQKKQ